MTVFSVIITQFYLAVTLVNKGYGPIVSTSLKEKRELSELPAFRANHVLGDHDLHHKPRLVLFKLV